MKNIKGFTLAEVLITLGIIGVVAALTIPTLMHNQRTAALKSQFAKANALVNTVVNQIVYDKSIKDLSVEYCYENDASCKSGEYAGMTTSKKLATDFLPYTNNVGSFILATDPHPVDSRIICNMDKSYCDIPGQGYGFKNNPQIFLKDGSIIHFFSPSNGNAAILFDINGYKGPNKLGYDVFGWSLQGTKAVPNPPNYGDPYNCQPTNGNSFSGYNCAQYAILDKCPWDSTKGYWECLP